MSNTPKFLILHCSDSAWGCAREINHWHKDRGWTGGPASKDVQTPEPIGYHFVILNGSPEPQKTFEALKGAIECGRDLDAEGSHCLGYNDRSLGICLVGIGLSTFMPEQFDALKRLCLELCHRYGIPAENVLGHCETDSGKAEGKTCPNFDVNAIRTYLKGRV